MTDLSRDNFRKIRGEILDDARKIVSECNQAPKLAIIQNGYNEASNTYVRNKVATCKAIGISVDCLKVNVDFKMLKNLINETVDSRKYDGIVIQLPLPEEMKDHEQELLDMIPWYMDVDGLSTESVGRLWNDRECLIPATAYGVSRLIDSLFPNGLNMKKVSIINRSRLIGKPLMKLMLNRNATVEVLHSKSHISDIRRAFKYSDLLITGIGNTSLIGNWEFASSDLLWIDCGIMRNTHGLCGDAGCLKSERISPVPFGVGQLTTASIALNVAKAQKTENRNG